MKRMKSKAATQSASETPALLQVGALPVRVGEDGARQVLLLTSRETKRWVIPKGWPMKGRKPWQAAAREALEEAGVVGRARKKSIGNFLYFKRRATSLDLCRVDVYLLDFAKQLETWREIGQRETRWVALEEAAEMVDEQGLAAILRKIAATSISEPKPRRTSRKAFMEGAKLEA